MNDGILLELLAELFQAMTSPAGVKVSRRRIFKIAKNDVAEIDILLEGWFGSAKMKVALECRDRVQPQGKDWIQQIVGKRDDLRGLGIRHWIAVSASGFTAPASDLAERSGIELLVPFSAEPVDPSAPGPHKLLSFQLTRDRWKFDEVNAEISHDDEEVLEHLRTALLSGALEHAVFHHDGKGLPLLQFLATRAEQQRRNSGLSQRGVIELEIENQSAELNAICFVAKSLQARAEPIPEIIKGTCKLLTFADPKLFEFMGLIGLNEFELDGDKVYLLVGFKPGYPAKLIFHTRTSTGAPIPGWVVRLDERQLQEAGLQSEPPQHLGSALLARILKGMH